MPVLNPDVWVKALKRKNKLGKRSAFEEGEENRRRKEERGVSPEEAQKGELPRGTRADDGDPNEPETPRRDDTPSTGRNPRSNASQVPRGMWLSQFMSHPGGYPGAEA
ncbi:hypothetical protein NDU88_004189 [Pleurodeles waltl]|uniref:Uncharacterized protein n=1 Tax=Pleurodeles waltl TaxID=8319 RepID=A0AAV7LHU0_PLEWA|nr:hypothetical protein NDU88_004189 [Pleurodeles waltl]